MAGHVGEVLVLKDREFTFQYFWRTRLLEAI